MNNIDFSKYTWSEWLEDAVHHLISDKAEKIIMVVITEDDKAATSWTDNVTTRDLIEGAFWLDHEAHNAINSYEEEQDTGDIE